MFSKELKVNCIKGEDIHWATCLVQISNEYSSSLRIKHKEHNMNAKSLLGVLSLELSNGDVVTITADGTDEKSAVEAVSNILMKILV